ncbi:MAG: hypothetical protein K0Q85_11 [Caproiciproducens sp.]|jgi:hypothetical protein|nr:hypothetical protein [Caproiciproducens sp.]
MSNRERKGQPTCGNCAEYVSATLLDRYKYGRCQLRFEQKKYDAVHFRRAACSEWRAKEGGGNGR